MVARARLSQLKPQQPTVKHTVPVGGYLARTDREIPWICSNNFDGAVFRLKGCSLETVVPDLIFYMSFLAIRLFLPGHNLDDPKPTLKSENTKK